MKNILSIIFLFLASSAIALDAPETIPPKTKVIHQLSWYANQSESWKDQVEKDPTNATAWLNYYSASRYASRSVSEMDKIAADAQKAIGTSYEAKIIHALNGGFSKESFKVLKDAYDMRSENPATYGLLLLFEEFNLSSSQRVEFSKKLLASGELSQSLLSYSYNVLMSVESNSILFVEGDNATLPLLVLQDAMNVRKDITILNLDLLADESYRNSKLFSLGLNAVSVEASASDIKKKLCAVIPKQNSATRFYYALTMNRDNISEINNQLYVVGLASQLSKDRLDNISIIKENLENRFLMDYLLVDFNGESRYSAGKVLSSNYLVPMLLLNDYYNSKSDVISAKKLKTLLLKIASESGKSDVVEGFLNRKEDIPASVVLIDISIKSVDAGLRLIKDNLYASSTEVTNAQYNLFLDYLQKNGPSELYEKCKIDLTQYTDPTAAAFFKGYHTYVFPLVKMHGRNNYGYRNYPIVNISHEAAQAYCEWLTQQYNGNSDRKFKKVKFRLPTLKEWQIAALGYPKFTSWNLNENTVDIKMPKPGETGMIVKGDATPVKIDDTFLYPWYNAYNFRNKAQNNKNCFMGNFKAPDDCKPCVTSMVGKDGWSMMAITASYFPNDMGLYDVVGNVSEMVDEEGKACGGSWNQSPEESTIRSIGNYNGPNAMVGFRLFMDVLDK